MRPLTNALKKRNQKSFLTRLNPTERALLKAAASKACLGS